MHTAYKADQVFEISYFTTPQLPSVHILILMSRKLSRVYSAIEQRLPPMNCKNSFFKSSTVTIVVLRSNKLLSVRLRFVATLTFYPSLAPRAHTDAKIRARTRALAATHTHTHTPGGSSVGPVVRLCLTRHSLLLLPASLSAMGGTRRERN